MSGNRDAEVIDKLEVHLQRERETIGRIRALAESWDRNGDSRIPHTWALACAGRDVLKIIAGDE